MAILSFIDTSDMAATTFFTFGHPYWWWWLCLCLVHHGLGLGLRPDHRA